MIQIPVGKEFFALVSPEDAESVSAFNWRPSRRKDGRVYAIRFEGNKTIYMHRQILCAGVGQVVDHADRNGLNNQRSNIRVCAPSQNMCNQLTKKQKLGMPKGVHKIPYGWRAEVWFNGKRAYSSCHRTVEDAVRARDEAAKHIHGEFFSPSIQQVQP